MKLTHSDARLPVAFLTRQRMSPRSRSFYSLESMLSGSLTERLRETISGANALCSTTRRNKPVRS